MNKALFEEAMQMPPNERVAFAELILASIEQEETEVKNAWIAEVKERMDAVSTGKAKLLDFESLFHES